MPTNVAGLPVGSVSVSGSDITVSALLNNPRLIDRRLQEMTQLTYWANRILPNVGDPGGGVVIYSEWSPTYSLLDRKAEPLAPDAEVPLAGTQEQDVKMVPVEADGLGYTITRPQEKRNQRYVIDRKDRGLANSIADKFNSRAVTAITAAISASSRTFASTDWSAVVTDGATPTATVSWPHSQIALIQAQNTKNRIPWNYDGMLIHPLDYWRLTVIYKTDSQAEIASRLNLAEIIVDNTGLVTHGAPILYSAGNVGGTSWEEPIMTEVIPEPRRRRKVVQATGSAAYFVDNPYGLLQLTGAAASDISGGVYI
jgi:hypothetical protein